MYAILRTSKLTTKGNIAGSLAHAFRTRETTNADAKLTPNNINMISNNSQDAMRIFEERLSKVKTVRKNAVLAIEYFIGHSPEYNNAEYDQNYFIDALEWLKQKHGAENVFFAQVHLDETTPHLTAIVIPITENPKGGLKLNASAFVDGKKALAEMQTDFAQNVGSQHGLKRGIEGSGAKHQTIKDYYAILNEPIKSNNKSIARTQQNKIELPTFTRMPLGKVLVNESDLIALVDKAEAQKKELANAHEKAFNEAKASQARAKVHADEAKNAKENIAKNAESAKKLAEEREKNKQLAAQFKELNLIDVLHTICAERDETDKSKWYTEAGTLNVYNKNGLKFKSSTDPDLKGGDAIDLVRKVKGYNFPQALSFLASFYGNELVTSAAVAKARVDVPEIIMKTKVPSEIPQSVDANWWHVRNWLTTIRKLSAAIVDAFHSEGRLYADKNKNAVFVDATHTNAEVYGTVGRFKANLGNKKEANTYLGNNKNVALVGSMIDGISLMTSHHEITGVISNGGMLTETVAQKAQALLKEGYNVLAAYDNDDTGDNYAKMIMVGYGVKTRIKPIKKDWNDDLTQGVQADIASQLAPIVPPLAAQRGWER